MESATETPCNGTFEHPLSTMEHKTKTQSGSAYEKALKSSKLTSGWLPPCPITKSQFDTVITFVDSNFCLYFQNTDSGM